MKKIVYTILILIVLASSLAGVAFAQQAPEPPTKSLPTTPTTYLYLYPKCKNNPEGMISKVDGTLRKALCDEKLESSFLVKFKDGKVQVYVYLYTAVDYTTNYTNATDIYGNVYTTTNYTSDDKTVTKLKETGLEIELINGELKVIQGWLPVDKIDNVEKIEEVKAIKAPDYAIFRSSEGVEKTSQPTPTPPIPMLSCKVDSDCVRCGDGCIPKDAAPYIECMQSTLGVSVNCKCFDGTCKSETVSVKGKEKIKVKDEKLVMETFQGVKEIKVMPDTASEIALNQLKLKDYEIELKDVGKPVYEIKGTREVKLFGLFKKAMPVKSQINAETGEIEQTKRPWWSFLVISKKSK